MNLYYTLTGFAQYGDGGYGTSEYGDSSGSSVDETPPLADTGYLTAPGFVFGFLMIVASLGLLIRRRPAKNKRARVND